MANWQGALALHPSLCPCAWANEGCNGFQMLTPANPRNPQALCLASELRTALLFRPLVWPRKAQTTITKPLFMSYVHMSMASK